MKKLVLSILLLLGFISNSYATGSAGFTINMADVNSTVKDDIDSNGTTDTTKDISNDVIFGSIFLERAVNENMSVSGTERRRLEKKKGLEIGSPELFEHWFDLPYLRDDVQLNENPVIASILRAIANKGYKVA